MSDVTLSLDEVYSLAHDTLIANGCDESNAQAVATTIHDAERDQCTSHGLFRLPGYLASLKSGKVDGKAAPEIEHLTPSVIKVHGNHAFAPHALNVGREALITATREHGIAAMVLVNVHHFAALWPEVEPLAEEGLVAMAMTTYKPTVVPAGGKEPLFGTNPIAFGWPRGDRPPVVFDLVTSSMAKGEVQIAARDGHDIPRGYGIDADGNPTTDPNAVLNGGALLPFGGGYKGSAICMMVELLVAGLSGQDFSFEAEVNDNNDGGPPNGGEFMLAIDPSRFGDDNWLSHSESFLELMAGMEGVRLPSDRRYAARLVTPEKGITIPRELYQDCLNFG